MRYTYNDDDIDAMLLAIYYSIKIATDPDQISKLEYVFTLLCDGARYDEAAKYEYFRRYE